MRLGELMEYMHPDGVSIAEESVRRCAVRNEVCWQRAERVSIAEESVRRCAEVEESIHGTGDTVSIAEESVRRCASENKNLSTLSTPCVHR